MPLLSAEGSRVVAVPGVVLHYGHSVTRDKHTGKLKFCFDCGRDIYPAPHEVANN